MPSPFGDTRCRPRREGQPRGGFGAHPSPSRRSDGPRCLHSLFSNLGFLGRGLDVGSRPPHESVSQWLDRLGLTAGQMNILRTTQPTSSLTLKARTRPRTKPRRAKSIPWCETYFSFSMERRYHRCSDSFTHVNLAAHPRLSTGRTTLTTVATVVNLHETKSHLSRLLDRAAAGEEIVVARAGRPVARLVALAPARAPRTPGSRRGRVTTSDLDPRVVSSARRGSGVEVTPRCADGNHQR